MPRTKQQVRKKCPSCPVRCLNSKDTSVGGKELCCIHSAHQFNTEVEVLCEHCEEFYRGVSGNKYRCLKCLKVNECEHIKTWPPKLCCTCEGYRMPCDPCLRLNCAKEGCHKGCARRNNIFCCYHTKNKGGKPRLPCKKCESFFRKDARCVKCLKGKKVCYYVIKEPTEACCDCVRPNYGEKCRVCVGRIMTAEDEEENIAKRKRVEGGDKSQLIKRLRAIMKEANEIIEKLQ